MDLVDGNKAGGLNPKRLVHKISIDFVQSAKTLLLAAVRAVFGEPRKVET